MELKINGELREVPDGLTVSQLLSHLQVPPGRVAVEVNADVIKRADHPHQVLKPGDAVEVVAFVGGG